MSNLLVHIEKLLNYNDVSGMYKLYRDISDSDIPLPSEYIAVGRILLQVYSYMHEINSHIECCGIDMDIFNSYYGDNK